MLTITFVAFIVIAGVPTFPATDPNHPFTDAIECWEAVDHALEAGDIKLGEGVKVDCIPRIDDDGGGAQGR